VLADGTWLGLRNDIRRATVQSLPALRLGALWMSVGRWGPRMDASARGFGAGFGLLLVFALALLSPVLFDVATTLVVP
jgi:hypothetical protein